jgi:hypothetical protein
MSEKVVLPKFDLPGQGPHPAIKALWIVGGLLGLSMLGLGGALWHHQSQQVAAEEAVKAAADARTAEAVAAADAAKAKLAADEQAKAQAKADAKAGVKTAGAHAAVAVAKNEKDDAGDKPAATADHKHGHHHASSHASHGGKTLANGDGHAGKSSASSSSSSNKKKDDAIDKLLASFK